MEISWLGHSCLKIRSGDVTLITDPYDDSLGLSEGTHRDHEPPTTPTIRTMALLEAILGSYRARGEYEIANFFIRGMGTDRNDIDGERRINTVFAIECEGLKLSHLGDLNHMLSSRQIEELSHTDILFVPAGGVCTISTSQMAELINLVDPKIVVPVHYRTEEVLADILPLAQFFDDIGVTEPASQSRLNVTDSSLPRELRLVVLERVR